MRGTVMMRRGRMRKSLGAAEPLTQLIQGGLVKGPMPQLLSSIEAVGRSRILAVFEAARPRWGRSAEPGTKGK